LPIRRTVFLILWLAASLNSAQQPLLKRVRNAVTAIQPFKADFIHQVFIDREKDYEESGEIVFANPQRLKWHYLKPENKIFILEGNRYQFFIEESNQLMRGEVGKKNEQMIWQMLFSENQGRDIHSDEKTRTIRIKSDSEREFLDIEIKIGDGDLPVSAVQIDPWGVKTIYQFGRYRAHYSLGPQEFELRLPKDVEIVDESGND
jgi:outer membrane lipoprotein-sorting protein